MSDFPEIPGFKFIKTEGKGPVGTVFRGRSEKGGALVAIKQISRQLTAHQSFRRRLRDDIKRLSRIHHPNIAHSIILGRAGDRYFSIGEYVEGDTVRERIREQHQIPEAEARGLILQAARGLAEAHHARLLHYDLKPSNLLTSDDDEVKVTDFMLDYHRYVGSVPSEQVYEMMEFPLYMSPEERESKPLTERSNIFSLGAILYHMLYDQPVQSIGGERLPPPELPKDHVISEHTLEILDLMLAEDPDDRFTEMDEVVHALEKKALGKADPLEMSLYAGVVIVLVLSLGLMARGMSKIEETPKVQATFTKSEPPQSRHDELLFQRADDYAFRFPDQSAKAIAMFGEVIREYPGTLYAINAQERTDALKTLSRKGEDQSWNDLKQNITRLRKQELYDRIQEEVEVFAREHPDNRYQENLEVLLKGTDRQQQESFKAIRERVTELMTEGDFSRAEKELKFVRQHFTVPELRGRALSDLGQLQVEKTQYEIEKNRPPPAGPEDVRFKEFASVLMQRLFKFRYLSAEQICKVASTEFKEKGWLQIIARWRKQIPEDQEFVDDLFQRIKKMPGKPSIRRGGNTHRVSSAEWGRVTVNEEDNVMYGWRAFSEDEILSFIGKLINRKSAEDQLNIARFYSLRGRWNEMRQASELAVSMNPSLTKKAKQWEPSAQFKRFLSD
jgi:serine/threonine protein kinase